MVLFVSLFTGVVYAQENSLNTFSPYSLYGLGDLSTGADATFVGMGGAAMGYRYDGFDTPGAFRLNTSNPASLSGLGEKNFIFDFGMAGTNSYLSQRSGSEVLKSSHNTFNIGNITAAFTLAPKLGMAVSVSPYSKVGYRIHTDDLSYLADLGIVRYYYNGSGEINQAKLQAGWAPFKRLSVGAEMTYLWGSIDRSYEAVIVPYTGSGEYGDISARSGATKANTNERVARILGGLGVQYTAIDKAKTRLTIGATYKMGGRLNSTVTDFIPSNNVYGDTIRFNEFKSNTRLASTLGVGAYLHKPKWAVGADWIYQNWGAQNKGEVAQGVNYVNTNTFKLGVQYTPNRLDIRGRFVSFLNRITYKAGVRYGDSYLKFRGEKISDKAVTLGLDIPLKALAVSSVDVGLEYGTRGTLRNGLVRENYFKINVGLMLFGRDYDYWFEKYKYN